MGSFETTPPPTSYYGSDSILTEQPSAQYSRKTMPRKMDMEILVIPLQGIVIQIYTSVSCEFSQYESIPPETHIPFCDLKQSGSQTKAQN